jgi:mRNA interferase MazF
MVNPSRGEIWRVNLNPTRGREQAGHRPCLVVSVDTFNHGPADLVIVLPITRKDKGIPLHVSLHPPEGGVSRHSFIKCEDVRSVSKERLLKRWGRISSQSMEQVEDRLRILMDL